MYFIQNCTLPKKKDVMEKKIQLMREECGSYSVYGWAISSMSSSISFFFDNDIVCKLRKRRREERRRKEEKKEEEKKKEDLPFPFPKKKGKSTSIKLLGINPVRISSFAFESTL